MTKARNGKGTGRKPSTKFERVTPQEPITGNRADRRAGRVPTDETEEESIPAPRGLLAHVGEPRVDRDYWEQPIWLRLYTRVIYGIGGMMLAGCVAGYMGLPDAVQWVVAVATLLVVLTFRWFFPNGMGNMLDDVMAADKEAREELMRGDYSGLPPILQGKKYREQEKAQKELEEKVRRNAEIKAKAKQGTRQFLEGRGKRR